MARKRSGDDGGGEGTWLNTYADMVTLLLTFFAVLLSMSTVNQEKFDAMTQAMKEKAPEELLEIFSGTEEGGPGDSAGKVGNMTDLYEQMKTYVNEKGMQSDVQLSLKDQVIFIKFNSSVIFEPNSYTLKSASRPTLDALSGMLVNFEPSIKMLNIYGHTAKVDSSLEDNYTVSSWMLSCDRAGAVARYMADEIGFNSDKMVAMGFGSTRPIGENSTSVGRAANRRVEFVVIGEDSDVDSDVYNQMNDFFDGQLYPTEGGTEDIVGTEVGSNPGGRQNLDVADPVPSGKLDLNVNPREE